jgi:hypothetical protein
VEEGATLGEREKQKSWRRRRRRRDSVATPQRGQGTTEGLVLYNVP